LPSAGFTASAAAILVDETVVFTSTSQYADSYLWDFGDGVTSTLANPTHVYAAPMQPSVVQLTVNNSCSSDVYTQTFAIYGQVVADFTPSTFQAKTGQAISFNNTSQNAESYAWDFGDGIGSSTEVEPAYTFTEVGTYTVTLQATNPLSQDSAEAVIVVNDVYKTYLPAVLRNSAELTGGQALRPAEIGRLDPRHFKTMCF
jgi:PKD repeat protein